MSSYTFFVIPRVVWVLVGIASMFTERLVVQQFVIGGFVFLAIAETTFGYLVTEDDKEFERQRAATAKAALHLIHTPINITRVSNIIEHIVSDKPSLTRKEVLMNLIADGNRDRNTTVLSVALDLALAWDPALLALFNAEAVKPSLIRPFLFERRAQLEKTQPGRDLWERLITGDATSIPA